MATHLRLVAALAVSLASAAVAAQPSRPVQAPIAPSAAGFRPLFDGKSLNGWRGYKKADATSTRWKVSEGMLCLGANTGAGALDIVTTDTFDDFELRWDWRVSLGGNSGLKYFVLEDMDSAIGHEYQIIDDERHPDAKIGPHRQTGAFYDVLPAANRPLRPAGEFNQSRLVVAGQHIEHWLNGAKVLEYDLGNPRVVEAIAKSKFKDVARFGKKQRGHILLQDHGDAVCYRDVMIRPGGAF
jgi:hypothetical protein